MLNLITEPEMPAWVFIFERIGPGSAILVFTGALCWKLLPAILQLLRAWKRQSDTITHAIPVAQDALAKLATNMERGFEKLASGRFCGKE